MRLIVCAALVALALTCLMGARVHIGDTIGRTLHHNHQAKVCDRQRDLHDAYLIFTRRGSSLDLYIKDENGVRTGCGLSNNRNPAIDSIKVCDRSPFAPGADCSRRRFIN